MAEKKPRPGELFEAAFLASVPRGIYSRKLRTPTAMGFVVPQLVKLIEDLSRILHRPVPPWVTNAARFRFTPKAGFDILLAGPAPVSGLFDGAGEELTALSGRPLSSILTFALELKSEDGPSLAFKRIDEDQEKALVGAQAGGLIAGVVIEFRGPGEVWFIPISRWLEAKAAGLRQSLPLGDARRIGMQIHRDVHRGTTNTYWNLAEWLTRCGVVLPERPVKKPAAPKPATAIKPGEADPLPLFR